VGVVYSQWAWYTHSGRGIHTVGVVDSQWAWYTHSGHGGLTVGMVYTQSYLLLIYTVEQNS